MVPINVNVRKKIPSPCSRARRSRRSSPSPPGASASARYRRPARRHPSCADHRRPLPPGTARCGRPPPVSVAAPAPAPAPPSAAPLPLRAPSARRPIYADDLGTKAPPYIRSPPPSSSVFELCPPLAMFFSHPLPSAIYLFPLLPYLS